jgi:hypothetical protein
VQCSNPKCGAIDGELPVLKLCGACVVARITAASTVRKRIGRNISVPAHTLIAKRARSRQTQSTNLRLGVDPGIRRPQPSELVLHKLEPFMKQEMFK